MKKIKIILGKIELEGNVLECSLLPDGFARLRVSYPSFLSSCYGTHPCLDEMELVVLQKSIKEIVAGFVDGS